MCRSRSIREKLQSPRRLYAALPYKIPGMVPPDLLERITIDRDVRFGKPRIRGHCITVQEILEWLSTGASQQETLADYPQLETDDFLAVYAYAAELAAGRRVSTG